MARLQIAFGVLPDPLRLADPKRRTRRAGPPRCVLGVLASARRASAAHRPIAL